MPTKAQPLFLPLLAGLCLFGKALGEEEKGVQLQFVSFPQSPDPKPVELRIGENEAIEVNLPSNNLSEVYQVKPMPAWALGKTVVDEKGQKAFETYGQVKSIGSNKQLILVVRKGNVDSEGFELIPLDNQASGFGGGKYLFMNASRVDIGGYIGEEKFTLKPGAMKVVSPGASADRGVRKVSFVKIFYRSGKEEATPFFSSEWRYSEAARTLAFVYHNPGTDRLRLHVIRDYIQ